ncbi:MAG: hypothetical protein ACMVO3_05635 [Thalassobaculum sp.]
MIVELGHLALACRPRRRRLSRPWCRCYGAARHDATLHGAGAVRRPWCSSPALILSFGALTHAFVTSDFSVSNVVSNSHSLKPLLYKISGVWGNHEGSMLLWVLILALFGAAGGRLRQQSAADSLQARDPGDPGADRGRLSRSSCCSPPTRSSASFRRRSTAAT